MNKTCTICHVTSSDLQTLLTWRNHPDVRRFMFSQNEIEFEEHLKWFEKVSTDPSRRLLIVEEGQKPLGFVQFTINSNDRLAEWGFYARPEAPKGSGHKIGEAALNYAFSNLKLHKVCGQAVDGNSASIRMHLRLGFKQEGILREQWQLDEAYKSIIYFGLLSHEWQAKLTNKEKPVAES